MRFQWEHLAAGAAAILVLMLTWFAGPIFHVVGTNALVLRGGILLLGVIAIIGLLLWAHSNRPQLPAADVSAAALPTRAPSGASEDVDILIRDAVNKVAAARLAAGAKLSALPAVFLLGESGAGKTTAMDQCGLDAELLAGQIFQESSIVPTRIANLWFARKTVFVEAGGPLVDDAASWARLIKHFLPGRFRSLFSRSGLAPRAAVVCVDVEKLIREPALDKIVAQARKLRSRLEELSYHLGVRLPVYVLFNRSDRIPYFDEFAGSFSNEEISQVLGTTLPITASTSAGVYAEQETRRLTSTFQGMFFALAECRPSLLHRERNSERQAGIYEFPREFGKLSKPLVQFLVDLCRPGHLRSGPFLRGFYFAGQRAVTVSTGGQTMLGTRSAEQRAPAGFSADATSLLSRQDLASKTSWGLGTQLEGGGEARRTVQRVFLSHVFSHVLLQDRAALGASGSTTRGDFGRRILMGTLTILASLWIIALLISFVGNAHLVSGVRHAAQDLSVVENPGSQLPAIPSLQRLDSLRQILVQLRDYDQNGAPLHLRWGLFSGDAILEDARAIYFQYFNRILFEHTRQNLLTDLRSYHRDPQGSTDAGSAYDALKTYLLTTSEYQRNRDQGEFLQDFLMKEWKRDLGELDKDHSDLAARQFAFYSSELSIDNPYLKTGDIALVDQVRAYLNKLAGAQRIYFIMLGDAGQKAKSYRFTVAHPDSFEVMRVSHDVSGAFTSDGWKVMDANIQNSKRFLQGEPWVLGAATNTNLSPAELSLDLRNLYEKDFIQQWRAFLAGARILAYKDDADAALKLKKLSSNSAPLLALICDISDNTNVASSPIKLAFQAPQQVVSPGCGAQSKYAQPSNAQYMTALLNLQQCAQEVADAPPDQKDAKKAQCSQTANQTLLAAQQIEQALPNDAEGHVDKIAGALLEEPIRAFLKIAGEGPGTDAMCKPYRILQALYPFNAHGKRDATLQEFNAFFQPGTGQLSQFLSTHKGAIALQGTKFVASSGGLVPAGSRLLSFVNEMYVIQQAVYPSNVQEPHFEYSVTGHLPEAGGYQSERLNFDGQELAVTGAGATKKFIWPGTTIQSATLSLNSGPGDLEVQREQGLWAVARFFAGYKWQPAGSAISIQGPLLGPTGQPQRINGKNVEVRFEVDFKGVPFFQIGRLSQYGCPANMKQ